MMMMNWFRNKPNRNTTFYTTCQHTTNTQAQTDPSVTRNADLSQTHDTSRYTQSRKYFNSSFFDFIRYITVYILCHTSAFILLPYRHEHSCCILPRFCDIRNQPILHNTGKYIHTYIHIQYKDSSQQPRQPYKWKYHINPSKYCRAT